MEQVDGLDTAPEAAVLTLKHLQQLLLAEFGASAAAKIQWCLSPLSI